HVGYGNSDWVGKASITESRGCQQEPGVHLHNVRDAIAVKVRDLHAWPRKHKTRVLGHSDTRRIVLVAEIKPNSIIGAVAAGDALNDVDSLVEIEVRRVHVGIRKWARRGGVLSRHILARSPGEFRAISKVKDASVQSRNRKIRHAVS